MKLVASGSIRGVTALALALSAGMSLSPTAFLVAAAVWLLPEWIKQWLDVRDHWRR